MFDNDDEFDEELLDAETLKLALSVEGLRQSVELLIPLVNRLINRHKSKDVEVRADLQRAYNKYAKAIKDLNELHFFEKVQ